MISCYVLGCEITSENNPDNIDFYKIAPNLRQKWCKAIGREPEKCKNEFICAKHFKQSDFFYGRTSKRLILNPGAVPSQSLQYIRTKDNKYMPIDLDIQFMSMSPPVKKIKTENDIKTPVPSNTPTVTDVKKPRIIKNKAKISRNLPIRKKIKPKPNPTPQICEEEENVENLNEIDTNSLLVPIIPKKQIRTVRVPKVDKSYERKKGIIQIFNASEVASDVESTDSDCIITDDTISTDSSDSTDPLSLDTNKSKEKTKVKPNQSKELKSNINSNMKQLLTKTNATSLISSQVETVLTISDESNDCYEVSSGNITNSNGSSQDVTCNVSTSAPVTSKFRSILKKPNDSNTNKIYQTFKNPLTNEHIQVALDPKEKTTVVDVSKTADKNTSLTNLVSQNIQSNEQYILIKPDNIHNITPEKIEKCIAILSDTFYDERGACHKCKFINIKNFNHDHHYYNTYTPVESKVHEALQERHKKQRAYLAEANRKIKKLYNEITDLEEIIKRDNEILDAL